METIVDLVQVLAGDVEPAEVAAAADRHDHAQRAKCATVFERDLQQAVAAAQRFDSTFAHLDVLGLFVKLVEQILLDSGAKAHLAGGLEVGRVGVDRLALGEVGHGLKTAIGFEDGKTQASFRGFERRGHAADAGADDQQVEDLRGLCFPVGREGGIGNDRAHGAGAGVGRKLEQRDAGQVADDVDAGQARAQVTAEFGQPLDVTGGPPGV